MVHYMDPQKELDPEYPHKSTETSLVFFLSVLHCDCANGSFEPKRYHDHLLVIQPLQLFDELRNKYVVHRHLRPQPG